MKRGIDISFYDARLGPDYPCTLPTDWTRAKESGIDLAMIKMGEGLREDPGFQLNWSAAKGIVPRLAWFWIRHNVNAIQQAQFALQLLLRDFDPEIDFLALDAESRDGLDAPACLRLDFSWLYEAEKAVHCSRIKYYTNQAYWKEGNGPMTYMYSAKKYGLWLADPRKVDANNSMITPDLLVGFNEKIESGTLQPASLAPWGKPEIWQVSWRLDPSCVPGHPGIKKSIDYNVVYMDIGTPAPAPPSLEQRVIDLERRVSDLEMRGGAV